MLFLQGTTAYTPFRMQQLLQKFQQVNPDVMAVSAEFHYFVDVKHSLSSNQLQRLQSLLPNVSYHELSDFSRPDWSFWVVPRLGTISPWCSKATDIAAICGLEGIARIERAIFFEVKGLPAGVIEDNVSRALLEIVSDPLTQSVISDKQKLTQLFSEGVPEALGHIDVIGEGRDTLALANQQYGLALSDTELDFLHDAYHKMGRNPTDVELMMFAQVNSEHCRHKIFNARWKINNEFKEKSLFSMIRHTYKTHPDNALVAYKDNAAVIQGYDASWMLINPDEKSYELISEPAHIVLKVETHNHPTGISPFAGAATGSGGEIRDEAATGRGAKTKAGLCGFSVSNLHIPGFTQPWESCAGKPPHLATPFEIMQHAPIGAAAFNNEFGRPNLCGYFRTFEMPFMTDFGEVRRGYHKPIMIAGGIGNIRIEHVEKKELTAGTALVVLGGPAMAIGLGGGAASSKSTVDDNKDLDFASVQRANPEMQRRAQQVINTCCNLVEHNPILSIHDVGAGGLSNAMPELVHACGLGARIFLRHVPSAEPKMSPLAIWCNEAQERYVLAIKSDEIERFQKIAERERCPFAIVGEGTEEAKLAVEDRHFKNSSVDMPMSVLFEDMPNILRSDKSVAPITTPIDTQHVDITEAVQRVLQFPCVADKSFLITIGDRSVGGLTARDQMVGPWQIPVADVAVTANSFSGYEGEAMAMGERAPIALLHHAASARMAVGEAITNIAASYIHDIKDIALSANWMAAADYPGEGAGLYAAVQAIAMEMCPALGISIPVGKDSLSMQTAWRDNGQVKKVTAPLSLVITAAAKVSDVRKTLTPELRSDVGDTKLMLIDLGAGSNALGGSVLAQVYNEIGTEPPDVDNPTLLKNFFKAIQSLNQNDLILAYHDRSDGGLLATVCEMMFAAHSGVTIDLEPLGPDPIASLFTEELGAVIQVRNEDVDTVLTLLEGHGLLACSHVMGRLNNKDALFLRHHQHSLYQNSRVELQKAWSETSYRMQALRDYDQCAEQEYQRIDDLADTGLTADVTFDHNVNVAAPYINKGIRPRVAILREQGVNGHLEMAAAFYHAGFDSVDVHMSDILNGHVKLKDFKGFAACGGFSYGDVLGAGRGWAQSVLMHDRVKDEFENFFHRQDTFALGVCNGCQMLSQLKIIIPGAEHWPEFLRNQSEQFEARLVLAKIEKSPSLFFKDMAGSILPVVVSHGEGRAKFTSDDAMDIAKHEQCLAMQYVDYAHQHTEQYPFNPNGSPQGITGLTTRDGRVTILMPHPERIFRNLQLSWSPRDWTEDKSPWMRMFYNARVWVG